MINKVALTENGNQYKKTNIGKIVGNVPTALISGLGIHKAITRNFDSSLNTSKSVLASTGIMALGALLIGTTLGCIIDSSLNNARRVQADGEAAKLNKQA